MGIAARARRRHRANSSDASVERVERNLCSPWASPLITATTRQSSRSAIRKQALQKPHGEGPPRCWPRGITWIAERSGGPLLDKGSGLCHSWNDVRLSFDASNGAVWPGPYEVAVPSKLVEEPRVRKSLPTVRRWPRRCTNRGVPRISAEASALRFRRILRNPQVEVVPGRMRSRTFHHSSPRNSPTQRASTRQWAPPIAWDAALRLKEYLTVPGLPAKCSIPTTRTATTRRSVPASPTPHSVPRSSPPISFAPRPVIQPLARRLLLGRPQTPPRTDHLGHARRRQLVRRGATPRPRRRAYDRCAPAARLLPPPIPPQALRHAVGGVHRAQPHHPSPHLQGQPGLPQRRSGHRADDGHMGSEVVRPAAAAAPDLRRGIRPLPRSPSRFRRVRLRLGRAITLHARRLHRRRQGVPACT